MATIGALNIDLTANSAAFAADMGRASRALNSSSAKMNRSLGTIERGFGRVQSKVGGFVGGIFNMRTAIGTLAGSAGLGLLVKSSLDAADAIGKTADKAGISTTLLQQMRFAGSQTGVAARDIDDAFTRLNRRLGLFVTDGAGPAAVGFKELEIRARDANHQVRSTEDIFADTVRKLQSYDNAAQKAALASAFFGEDAGPRLVNLLAKGSAGVAELRDRASELGLVLREDLVRQAEATNDRLSILGQTIKVRAQGVVLEFADEIEVLAVRMTEAIPVVVRYAAEFARLLGRDRADQNRTPGAISASQIARNRRASRRLCGNSIHVAFLELNI